MKLSEFQQEYHWMYGLQEYFNHKSPDHALQWDILHKALWHDNWYRKRDILLDFYDKEKSNPTHLKAWLNILFHEHMQEIEMKPQLVVTMMRKFMDEDPFLVSLTRFINYWTGGDESAATMPDINDFLSRGQVQSKLWMVDELKNIIDEDMGTVMFYGGWYNFAAHFLFENFNVEKVYSLDLNVETVNPSKKLYQLDNSKDKFFPCTADVETIVWTKDNSRNSASFTNENRKNQLQEHATTQQSDKEEISRRSLERVDNVNCIVNTSCEHMGNKWFEDLPNGMFVILQTNDYFENEQHSNCCEDLAAAKAKYPMSEIYYEGELDTQLYNRFMLIGKK